ncbi:MAG TPA: hypothetical protein VGX71_11175 [Pseudaminobacter sp.]|jgi:excinuclease ABC subunit B|nr:hypothetical protein [Pseudaminobacter sp.]
MRGSANAAPPPRNAPHGEPVEPRRERVGIGSYEDPSDARKQKRRSKKIGRPGR